MSQDFFKKPVLALDDICSRFKITLGPTGWSKGNVVELNGKVLPGVKKLTIEGDADGLTVVTISLLATVEAEVQPSIYTRKPYGLGNPHPMEDLG